MPRLSANETAITKIAHVKYRIRQKNDTSGLEKCLFSLPNVQIARRPSFFIQLIKNEQLVNKKRSIPVNLGCADQENSKIVLRYI